MHAIISNACQSNVIGAELRELKVQGSNLTWLVRLLGLGWGCLGCCRLGLHVHLIIVAQQIKDIGCFDHLEGYALTPLSGSLPLLRKHLKLHHSAQLRSNWIRL